VRDLSECIGSTANPRVPKSEVQKRRNAPYRVSDGMFQRGYAEEGEYKLVRPREYKRDSVIIIDSGPAFAKGIEGQ